MHFSFSLAVLGSHLLQQGLSFQSTKETQKYSEFLNDEYTGSQRKFSSSTKGDEFGDLEVVREEESIKELYEPYSSQRKGAKSSIIKTSL